MKITYGVGAGLAPAQNPGRIPNTAGATARVAPTNRIYRRTGIEALTRLIHVMAETCFSVHLRFYLHMKNTIFLA
jgi:hypothetical protein